MVFTAAPDGSRINVAGRSGQSRKNNAIDLFLLDRLTPMQMKNIEAVVEKVPLQLSWDEKTQWLKQFNNVVLSSDAFMPFRDTIDRAAQSGVKYVVQPGNSIRDNEVIEACDSYGMVMAVTGIRLFHH